VRQAEDTRPALVHRIRKERDLRIIRQDGKTADLFELRGKVWVINVISLNHPEPTQRSLDVMKRLAEKQAGNPDFALVTLAIDPVPAEQAAGFLATGAQAHGMKLPQWWLGTNEPATLHKFIKTELKSNVHPHEKDGQWIHDTSIVLIDKNGHLRRAVVPQKKGGPPFIATFDFDQAATWDAEGHLTNTERTNIQELEFLLDNTIGTLLAETAEKP
jgi:cytochrome oxidase Cu insertion factor (SCO1/SenC/PrrC family)